MHLLMLLVVLLTTQTIYSHPSQPPKTANPADPSPNDIPTPVKSLDTLYSPGSAKGYTGQTSLGFETNRSLIIEAPIQKLLLNAEMLSQNLTWQVECNQTIGLKIGKCDVAFYRWTEEVDNITILFDQVGVAFLIDATNVDCNGGYYPDGEVHFIAKASQPTRCIFRFSLNEEDTGLQNWTQVTTASPNFYFYELSPMSTTVEEDDISGSSSIGLYALAIVAIIVVMSVCCVRCLTSDGLGDDKKSIQEEGKSVESVPLKDIVSQSQDDMKDTEVVTENEEVSE